MRKRKKKRTNQRNKTVLYLYTVSVYHLAPPIEGATAGRNNIILIKLIFTTNNNQQQLSWNSGRTKTTPGNYGRGYYEDAYECICSFPFGGNFSRKEVDRWFRQRGKRKHFFFFFFFFKNVFLFSFKIKIIYKTKDFP